MSRYSVTLRATVTREVEIEAESPHEAAKLVGRRCVPEPSNTLRVSVRDNENEVAEAFFSVDGVDELLPLAPEDTFGGRYGHAIGESWDYIGDCEACSTPLLDSGDLETRSYFSCGEDGGYLCPLCAAKCVEEAGADEEPSAPGGGE